MGSSARLACSEGTARRGRDGLSLSAGTAGLLVASCAAFGGGGAPDREAIQRLFSTHSSAVEAGALVELSEVFTDDVVLLPPSPGIAYGKEAALEVARRSLALFSIRQEGISEELEVGDGWAFHRGVMRVQLDPVVEGDVEMELTRFLYVVRREEDGAWRYARLAWNNDSPDPEPPVESSTAGSAQAKPIESARRSYDSEASEARTTVQWLIAADNANELDAVLIHYTDDAILLPPGSSAIRGIDAVRRHYARLFETGRVRVEHVSYETQVCGDWAFDWGETRSRVTGKEGGDASETAHKYLMILRRDRGVWKVSRLLWNPA